MAAKEKNMLRISELAQRAQVSVPTIKHYVHEGLIDKPVKTGKTMAYYHESMVERVRTIKRLQREKFLPLDVIKRMLDSEGLSGDDAELGRAFFKSSALVPESDPVPETQVERRTDYPLDKVRVLEQEGLVRPLVAEEDKLYTAIDLRIIEIMKLREDLGVPFDHSLDTVKAYRDGIRDAVDRDLRLFAASILGDVPARQAARLMTEADDSLDSFMALFRRRIIREAVEDSVRNFNQSSRRLALLNFLPLADSPDREDPPDKAAGDFTSELANVLFRSDYSRAQEIVGDEKHSGPATLPAWEALLYVLQGEPGTAVEIIKRHYPEPVNTPFVNASAALSYIFAMEQASGFSTPVYLLKRCLSYLDKTDEGPAFSDLENAFARYVCGCVYVMLPPLFDTVERGMAILESLDEELKNGRLEILEGPTWLRSTIKYHACPAARMRLHRFLAEVRLERDEGSQAEKSLEVILRTAPVGSEDREWAEKKRTGLQ